MFIVRSRKEIIWGLVLIVVGLTIGAVVKFTPQVKTFGYGRNTAITVVVDAGHGLPDGGTTGVGGTPEHKINLAVAKKLEEVLTGKGIKVIMTRTDENSLYGTECTTIREKKRDDMNKRLAIMKKGDLFVSIHMNYFDKASVKGLHIFYSKNHPKTEELAKIMQEKLCAVTGSEIKPVKAADSSLFLMKNPPVPAILAECGFLSNAQDEKNLNTEEYQARLAWAIADSIEKYYQN